MTITPERLAELIRYHEGAANMLQKDSVFHKIHIESASELRELQRLRGMTSAEAGERDPRRQSHTVFTEPLLDAAAIADQRDTLLGLVIFAEELLREAPMASSEAGDEWCKRRDDYLRERQEPYQGVLCAISKGELKSDGEYRYKPKMLQGSECKTCKGTKVIGNGGSMNYGEFITLPCPDCGERKAVVEGNCGLRKLLSLLRENKLGQFCRDLNRAIALLSQEGLSDELHIDGFTVYEFSGGLAIRDADGLVTAMHPMRWLELRKQVEEQKQFMSHKDGCHSVNFHYPNGDPGKCDCGLSAYLGEG